MAFGDSKGTLTASAASVTNPSDATGSVAVVVGDLIFGVFAEQTSLTAGTVTDNLGNTYTATNAGTDAGNRTGRAYYSRVTVAGTLTTVHFAATSSADDYAAAVVVIEGPFASSPLDTNPGNITSDVTSPFNCPATGTLAQALEVVMSWGAGDSAGTWTATSPTLLGVTTGAFTVRATIGYQATAATTSVVPVLNSTVNPSQLVLGTSSFMAASVAPIGGWETQGAQIVYIKPPKAVGGSPQ